jgi:VIT1/CCC1 family predicted Fe2+/Mn2+ transporter
VQRGLSEQLARQVAEELTAKDVVRAHARDELGIDIDELANPFQVGQAVPGGTGDPEWLTLWGFCTYINLRPFFFAASSEATVLLEPS